MFLIRESVFDGMEILTEQTANGKKFFIEGPMIMCDKLNRNRRIYPRKVMEPAVELYVNNFVNARRALGELNHPEERPFADPRLAALKVETLSWTGNDVYGKAQVLNTTEGKNLQALIEADFALGMSTRGLGDTTRDRVNKCDTVTSYQLNAIDAVDHPSGQICYMNVINESVQWVEEGGIWVSKSSPVVKEGTLLTESDMFLALAEHLRLLSKAQR